jgi:hypothetical protein
VSLRILDFIERQMGINTQRARETAIGRNEQANPELAEKD